MRPPGRLTEQDGCRENKVRMAGPARARVPTRALQIEALPRTRRRPERQNAAGTDGGACAPQSRPCVERVERVEQSAHGEVGELVGITEVALDVLFVRPAPSATARTCNRRCHSPRRPGRRRCGRMRPAGWAPTEPGDLRRPAAADALTAG